MFRADHVASVLRRSWAAAVAAVLALLALGSWALSSPVGSAPDDDFHLASIWCGDGLVAGRCAPGDAPDERRVPGNVIAAHTCYAFHPEVSAACQGGDLDEHPSPAVSTARGNFAGQYPPLYYAFMGIFAGPDVSASVVAMRLVAGVVFVGLITAVVLLIPPDLRPMAIAAPLVALVPLGLSLVSSTNPSGWALLAGSLLLPALAGYLESHGARRVALAALAIVATLLGAGARADAAAYAILTVVIVVILFGRRSRRFLLDSWLLVVVVAIAAVFFFGASQTDVLSTGFVTEARGPSAQLLLHDAVLLPGFWMGFFGAAPWGLGWLDTDMPPIVWVLGFAVVVAVATIGLSRAGWRRALGFALVALALCGIPLYTLLRSGLVVGAYLQPRYLLPLLIVAVALALAPDPAGPRPLVAGPIATPLRVVVLGGALVVMNAVALQVTMRRYITGDQVQSVGLDARGGWWWSGPVPSPDVVWIGGSLAFALLVALLGWRANAARRGVAAPF